MSKDKALTNEDIIEFIDSISLTVDDEKSQIDDIQSTIYSMRNGYSEIMDELETLKDTLIEAPDLKSIDNHSLLELYDAFVTKLRTNIKDFTSEKLPSVE